MFQVAQPCSELPVAIFSLSVFIGDNIDPFTLETFSSMCSVLIIMLTVTNFFTAFIEFIHLFRSLINPKNRCLINGSLTKNLLSSHLRRFNFVVSANATRHGLG